MSEPDQRPEAGTGRMRLLLNLGAFQLKLLMDWGRDLLLAPASFFAVIYGIIAGGDKPDQYFNRLMAMGRRSDRFINLFDEYTGDNADPNHKGADDYLAPYKDRLIEQAQNSGIADKANRMVDDLVDQSKPGRRERNARLEQSEKPPVAKPDESAND